MSGNSSKTPVHTSTSIDILVDYSKYWTGGAKKHEIFLLIRPFFQDGSMKSGLDTLEFPVGYFFFI